MVDRILSDDMEKMDKRVRRNRLLAKEHGCIIEDMDLFEKRRSLYVFWVAAYTILAFWLIVFGVM
ncbi:hypothetical protein KY315_02490 [Candidatus Woesearchaeota archaeon]|nr:hypothetical protein [Candidatus Woesearchaeota archaeon]